VIAGEPQQLTDRLGAVQAPLECGQLAGVVPAQY
jgi:hypothetical protein